MSFHPSGTPSGIVYHLYYCYLVMLLSAFLFDVLLFRLFCRTRLGCRTGIVCGREYCRYCSYTEWGRSVALCCHHHDDDVRSK